MFGRSFDVVTIGTAARDVFLTSDFFKIVHDPSHLEQLGIPQGDATCFALGSKIEIAKPVVAVGGGAANCAVTFARQGFATACIFKIGRDLIGRDVISDLERERVKPIAIYDTNINTSYSIILLSPGGERTIMNYRGASEFLKFEEIPSFPQTKFLYVVPGKIPYRVIYKIVSRFKQSGAKVAINLSKLYLELGLFRLKPLLSLMDAIILNREEASYLTKKPYKHVDEIFKVFDDHIDGLAVMTDGPDGVMVSDGERVYNAGIYQDKKIIDRTGAGDAFGSGFVAGLIKGMKRGRPTWTREQIEYAIKLGSANATSVVEKIGAQEGILRRGQFERERRWRKLPLAERDL